MTAASDALLDLAPSVGQRASTVRFDLLDSALAPIGRVALPADSSRARITMSTTRAIMRDLSGLWLDPVEQAAINPFADRIRPVWILEDGSEFELGVFIFGSMDRVREEWGLDARVAGVDQTVIVDQPITETVALDQGDGIRAALSQQLTTALVPQWVIDPAITDDLLVGAPIVWAVGVSRLQVINDLAALAGAFPLYFDNQGVGQIEVVVEVSDPADHTYVSGGTIIAGSMVESDDLLDAPNQYLTIDSASPDAAISGVYDVPDSAPFSFAARGFFVVQVINEQGLVTPEQAVARGLAEYTNASATYQWVQFSSLPDPRHDTFDTVSYLGDLYREQGWALPLAEGAEMTHDLRRVWTA